LTHHQKITRSVKELPNGVETLTESNDPEVSEKIKEHVEWMKYRVEETLPIRRRDPLFDEIFRHTDKITMERHETDHGVRVVETSDDPYVAKLIKAHARVVSGFVARGFDEAMKNHPVPTEDAATSAPEKQFPIIAGYGGVVPLSEAAQQPRPNSRIVVDLTAAGEPDKLLPAIEKVARYVNLYAGNETATPSAQIAVVLHGDATLAALNADAYRVRFGTENNPNLDCLHRLHEAGVELYVCGQSLIAKGARPEDTAVFVDVALSAVTSLVNLQADGYAYVPLAH
jgi:intracellular sulfur oxidation DsrE/DsrF family protein